MFEQELFRVKAGIADGLAGLKILKNFVVQSQQYEYAAKLNDIKKHLESAGKELSFYGHPELNKGLTPNGKLFHNQLFDLMHQLGIILQQFSRAFSPLPDLLILK